MSRWYRAYPGTVTDAKLGEVAMIASCSRSVAIAAWHALLEDCCTTAAGGRFTMSARRLAVILGEPMDLMTAVLNAFEELAMTQGGTVTAWSDRQYESDTKDPTAAARMRRYRARNVTPENEAKADPSPAPETPSDASVTVALRGGYDQKQITDTETEGVEPPNPRKVSQRRSRVPEKDAAVATAAAESFERFWTAYPDREGGNPKHPAALKFLGLVRAGVDPEAIIAGAVAYARSVAGQDPRFVAQAVTWLNQRRWQDHHSPATPTSARRNDRDERTPLARAFDELRADIQAATGGHRSGPGADGYPMLDLTPVAGG